jgi:hypothetical protein
VKCCIGGDSDFLKGKQIFLLAAARLAGISWNGYLLRNENGHQIKEYPFKSAWQRQKKKQ